MICDRLVYFFALLVYCLLFTWLQFIYFLSIAFCLRALSLFTFCLFAIVYFLFAFLLSFCLTLYLIQSDYGYRQNRQYQRQTVRCFPQIPHQHSESNISDYQIQIVHFTYTIMANIPIVNNPNQITLTTTEKTFRCVLRQLNIVAFKCYDDLVQFM